MIILKILNNHKYNLELSRVMCRRRQWHPTAVPLPGKSHGQRSLVGCGPWGRWESDMIGRLHSPFSLSCTGEGNGSPLQCSCLGNSMDRGTWWATVHAVAKELDTTERARAHTHTHTHTHTHSALLYHWGHKVPVTGRIRMLEPHWLLISSI